MTHPIQTILRHMAETGEELTAVEASTLSGWSRSQTTAALAALAALPFAPLLSRSIRLGAHRPTLSYRVNPAWAAVAYPHLTPSPRDVEAARQAGAELVERGLLPPWTPDAHYVAAATPVVTTGSTTALAAWAAGCGADTTPEVRDAVRRTLIHLGVPPHALEGL